MAETNDAKRGGDDGACSCGCRAGTPTQLVYALGQIGCNLASDARRFSLLQGLHAKAAKSSDFSDFGRPDLVAYLKANPWDSDAVEWTLERDGIPMYAIRPQGPFAADVFEELREMLENQLAAESEPWSAVPGRVVAGAGQSLPVIVPDLRGMYYWTTEALIDAARERLVKEEAGDKLPKFDAGRWEELLRDFLERVYHGMRNQGLAPQDRAVNHAATDVFQAGKAIATVLRLHKEAELERVRVRPCSISHAHSCCCEIELSFSNVSKRSATLRRAYRYMIDASDVVPVTVGAIRSWSE